MLKPYHWAHAILAAATLSMAASLFYLLAQLASDQAVQHREFRETFTWSSTQVEREARRLGEFVARYRRGDPEISRQRILDAFDVFWSRVDTISQGVIGQRYMNLNGAPQTIAATTQRLQRLEPLLARLERGDSPTLDYIQSELGVMFEQLYELTLAGHVKDLEIREQQRHWFDRFYHNAVLLLIGVLLSGALLVTLIFWHDRKLKGLSLTLEARVRDRTRRLEQANLQLRASEEKYRLIFESLQDVYYELNSDGTVREISPSVTTMLGYSREDVIGTRLWRLCADHKQLDALLATLATPGTVADAELSLRDKRGIIRVCSLNIQRRHDNGAGAAINAVFYGTLRDISERKRTEEQISYRAYHDTLTGLPNRSLLLDRINQALAQATRHGTLSAALFLDLDNFKPINDALGHQAGDRLLREVAIRLQSCLRQSDTAARLGGDEFVVLLDQLGKQRQQATLRARAVAEKIRDTLATSFTVGNTELNVTPSIGITLFPDATVTTADEVLKQADAAMYRAKAAGRNTIVGPQAAAFSGADKTPA